MDKDFIDILKKLISEQGKESLIDPRKCKAFISDYTEGHFIKESRWLLLAIEAKTALAIDTADDLSLCKKQHIQKLEEDIGLSSKVAVDLVNALAFVLRGDTSVTESEKTITAQPQAALSQAKPQKGGNSRYFGTWQTDDTTMTIDENKFNYKKSNGDYSEVINCEWKAVKNNDEKHSDYPRGFEVLGKVTSYGATSGPSYLTPFYLFMHSDDSNKLYFYYSAGTEQMTAVPCGPFIRKEK